MSTIDRILVEENRPADHPDRHTGADWRLQIPEDRRRHLRLWFGAGAAFTVLILVVGGITRLTQSGLSIVEWAPILGAIPPLNEADWREAFARYQQFPEYQELNRGMTLERFKVIYFWEYLHRLLARAIGLVFLIPFIFFLVRGYFNRPLLRASLVLFGLGALQGFMGWFMVMSGLVDDPRVSHYRLAAHLTIALAIFALCLWLVRELGIREERPIVSKGALTRARRAVALIGVLLGLQILWGAFVAGLDAGLVYNSFPLMDGRVVPRGIGLLDPALRNLVENPIGVQWTHRVLGTLLTLVTVGVAVRSRALSGDRPSARYSAVLAGLMVLQFALGALTVVLYVPLVLGMLHQLTAVAILGVWVVWAHHVTRNAKGPGSLRAPRDLQPSLDPVS